MMELIKLIPTLVASGLILGIMKNDTVDIYDFIHFSTTL